MTTAKKPPPKKPAKKPAKKPSERDELLHALAGKIGGSVAEIELRALRELAARWDVHLGPPPPKPPEPAPTITPHGALPKRLFILLDGRGLADWGLRDHSRLLDLELVDVEAALRPALAQASAPS